MTKKQYLDLLRYYFIHARKEDVEEIIADYEEHFRIGTEQGLVDEEIIQSLGAPEDIYEAYISEEIVTEKRGLLKGDVEEIMRVAQRTYKENVEPQIPKMVKGGSKILLMSLAGISYCITAICWIFTPLLLYVLTTQWHVLSHVAPLPPLSLVTIISLGCVGFFGGLTFLLVGNEFRKYIKYGNVLSL